MPACNFGHALKRVGLRSLICAHGDGVMSPSILKDGLLILWSKPDKFLQTFNKAMQHHKDLQVMLLGYEPIIHSFFAIGVLCDPPKGADYEWVSLKDAFVIDDVFRWDQAGNAVQWWPQA
jgi:hypothetical protein